MTLTAPASEIAPILSLGMAMAGSAQTVLLKFAAAWDYAKWSSSSTVLLMSGE